MGEFWLSEAQFARLAPLLPTGTRGVARVDDRRVISGIVHVLMSGGRWVDAPPAYGPRKTLYNRWVRWARKGVWQQAFAALAAAGGPPAELMLDLDPRQGAPLCGRRKRGAHANAIGRSRGGRTTKIHALVDGQGRMVAFALTPGQCGDAPVAADLVRALPPSQTLAADRAYDSDALRAMLLARGTRPVIPNGPRRKRLHPLNPSAYKRRNLVERAFCRLKDFRRVATRYDKIAATYAAAVALAASSLGGYESGP